MLQPKYAQITSPLITTNSKSLLFLLNNSIPSYVVVSGITWPITDTVGFLH
jgi:hypothetical protein